MKAPKQWTLNVTLETASGRIIRRVTLTDVFLSKAKFRASQVAPKPGQTVVSVEVAR